MKACLFIKTHKQATIVKWKKKRKKVRNLNLYHQLRKPVFRFGLFEETDALPFSFSESTPNAIDQFKMLGLSDTSLSSLDALFSLGIRSGSEWYGSTKTTIRNYKYHCTPILEATGQPPPPPPSPLVKFRPIWTKYGWKVGWCAKSSCFKFRHVTQPRYEESSTASLNIVNHQSHLLLSWQWEQNQKSYFIMIFL